MVGKLPLGGTVLGLRGQSMGGPAFPPRVRWQFTSDGPGTYNLIIPVSGIMQAYVWGAGGSGSAWQSVGGTLQGPGGGGGASFKQFGVRQGGPLRATVGAGGASVSGVAIVGNPGGDSFVEYGAIRFGATGGGGGPSTGAALTIGGLGGRGFGGDVNRPGGTPIITATAGIRDPGPTWGSLGGISTVNGGGGGGAGGFTDWFIPNFNGQNGQGGNSSGGAGQQGGGGGAPTGTVANSGAGGAGRIFLVVFG